MKIAAFFFLCLAATLAGGAEPTAIPIVEPRKFVTVENGTIKINGAHRGVVSTGAKLSIAKPVKIRMKMRRVATTETPGHFGLDLQGGDDFRGHFYTHDGVNFIAALHQGKTKISDRGNRGQKEMFPAKADAPWINVELYVQPKLAEIHVAGNPQGMVNANLLPLKALNLYGYHNDIEVKDLAWEPLAEAEEASTDPNPSFHASFDEGLAGRTAQGELAPTKAVKVERVPGVSGQAVRVAAEAKPDSATAASNAKARPALEYAADGLFANHGTLMFWMKSDWDGAYTGNITHYPMIAGLDAAGQTKLNIVMTWWISFGLGRTGSLKPEEMKRESRSGWYRGDWNHIAMVWNDGDWCKAYFNGLPYQQPFGFNGKIITNLDLKTIARLTVGSGPGPAEAAFDELKIYRRPLSNGEIYDEYRKFMPADLLLDRAVMDAGQPGEVVVRAAPGGYYMRPMPAARPLTAGRVQIKMQLAAEDGQVVAEKEFSPKLAGPTELRLPVKNLPAGKYRLRCAVGPVQRSFELVAYQPRPAMSPTDDGIELGEVIFAKDLKDGNILDAGGTKVVRSPIGEYLEGGERKEHRFSFEVPFPEKYLDGRPVMLEIEWPDDKPRSMGLYMYRETKQAQHRDRLGGGIQSGVEYPLTGQMQKTRYLFHPGLKSYLFEARTMISKFPAAIAGFRVYEIRNERLPRLAVKSPENLPPRRFGYCDEDETFDQNLGWDYPIRDAQVITERLLDYLDYTGQNAWQYPFMRYNGYNFPMEGALHNGLYPYHVNAFRYMVEALSRRGKITIAGINLFTLPELKLLPDQTEENVRKGWILTKFSDPPVQPGNQFTRPNHANPEVRAMIARHVKETAQRFARVPGFDGVNLTTHSIGFYSSLDDGYDDYTVGLFAKETGVEVAATRPSERHAFLTREPQLAAWMKWRNKQSVELYRLVRSQMTEVSPDLKLYLNIAADAPTTDRLALFDELRAIRGVYLVPQRGCTMHRWRLFWGKPSDGCNDTLYNPLEAAKLMNGKVGLYDSNPTYFESFNGSLKNDVYAGYFQNADVKPFGRYFLKELAFAVAAMDAQRILIGAQPLGTWGREAETREFARAYCALPAVPFESAPGPQDPVTVRYAKAGKGSYLYAVSMLWGDCETALTLSSKAPLQDLSTGEVIANGPIKLKPFELRAFYSKGSRLKVSAVKTTVPGRVLDYYRQELDKVQKTVARLTADKIACGDAEAVLARMREMLEGGQLAELHRLRFSLALSEVMEKADNFANFSEQAAMIRRGHYAVNCGATGFYRAKNGTLFFPDRALGSGEYGYVGAYQNVVRNTDGLQAEDPELFMTEAYGVDAYRFKVTPGKYKVRLYLKAGYKKGFKPDTFVFSVAVQGTPVLENFDVVTACNNDFCQAIIKETSDVEVKNDVLEIKFSVDEKHHPTAKLVNAIEVMRQ